MMSCQRESVNPSPTLIDQINGQWKCLPSLPLSTGDTTLIVNQSGNSSLVYNLDYIIHDPINLIYDSVNNQITINGTANGYQVNGTGYMIGSDTIKLVYTIQNTSWQNYQNTYYKLQ